MCCFSGPVHDLGGTRIFARAQPDGRQTLAYQMRVAFEHDVAMVLPIPIARGPNGEPPPEDAVRWIDLSPVQDFFEQLERLYWQTPSFGPQSPAPAAKRSILKVVAVGDFEASFVPTLEDFDRLAPPFRLSDEVWARLPAYRSYGFCVFKLRADSAEAGHARGIHPMAFDFPRRDPDTLFFPTVHVHDGRVHDAAVFDHTLYAQVDPAWTAQLEWERSLASPSTLPERFASCVDRSGALFRTDLHGSLPNRDTTLSGREIAAAHRLGPSFRLRIKRVWETADPSAVEPEYRAKVERWSRLTASERARLRDATFDALEPVFAQNRASWRLAAFDPVYPVHRPTRDVAPPLGWSEPAHTQVAFYASTDRIEPQELTVAFEGIPRREVLAAVQSAFQNALDRALPSQAVP